MQNTAEHLQKIIKRKSIATTASTTTTFIVVVAAANSNRTTPPYRCILKRNKVNIDPERCLHTTKATILVNGKCKASANKIALSLTAWSLHHSISKRFAQKYRRKKIEITGVTITNNSNKNQALILYAHIKLCCRF